jgi:hypothetical protein
MSNLAPSRIVLQYARIHRLQRNGTIGQENTSKLRGARHPNHTKRRPAGDTAAAAHVQPHVCHRDVRSGCASSV